MSRRSPICASLVLPSTIPPQIHVRHRLNPCAVHTVRHVEYFGEIYFENAQKSEDRSYESDDDDRQRLDRRHFCFSQIRNSYAEPFKLGSFASCIAPLSAFHFKVFSYHFVAN